jgi:sterol desaturase/sphingolipid hydroxylase (fatty acid hydroxylase superfamily)
MKTFEVTAFLSKQVPTIFVIWICSIFLAYPDRNLVQITVGVIFVEFWIYFIHRLGHSMPKDGILGMLNTHWQFHHQHHKLLDRRVELIIEMFTDLSMNFTLLGIQWLTGVWFVPFSIILYHALVYTSVHIINYSMVGSETHKKHHLNHDTNYGPDTMDHIFASSEDGELEDMTPILINAFLGFGLVFYLKSVYGWTD